MRPAATRPGPASRPGKPSTSPRTSVLRTTAWPSAMTPWLWTRAFSSVRKRLRSAEAAAAAPPSRALRGRLDRPPSYDTPVIRLVVIGLAAGIFSALFGVGGGIVAVPLLVLLVHFPERAATATSLGAIGITALAGAVVFGIRGDIEVAHAALVGIPAAVGALAGTTLQQRVTGRALSYAFAVLLVAVAVWLLA